MFAIPYFSLIAFFIFSFFANNSKKTELSVSLKYFCWLYLIVFIGFRGFVSTDWVSYYPVYQDLQVWREIDFKYLGSFGWEIGTPLSMFLLKKIGFDYFGYCFISSFIDLLVFFSFFKKYSENFYLSAILFVVFNGLTMEFNLLRNSKAIDLFLVSLKYLDKKKWKYFFINIFGYFFHFTALFFILFFFIYHSNFFKHKKLVLLLWFCGLVIFSLKIQFIGLILGTFADFLPGRLRWLAKHYTTLNENLSSYGFGLGFIERFLTFILVYKTQDNLIEKNKSNKIFISMTYVYLFSFLYLAEVFELVGRITTLMTFGYWIIFPAIYGLLSPKKKKYFVLILLAYSVLKVYAIFGNDLSLKYENILFEHQTFYQRKVNNFDYRLKELK